MVTIRTIEVPGNPFATPQALRASALKWQLISLAAQAKPFLLAGLNVTTQRCHTCSPPEL